MRLIENEIAWVNSPAEFHTLDSFTVMQAVSYSDKSNLTLFSTLRNHVPKLKILIILSIIALLGILWKAYPHILIPRPFPSDEVNNLQYTFWLKQHNGVSADSFSAPHLTFYIIYFVSSLGINPLTISYFFNPIISGLTTFPFYYFVSTKLTRNQSVIATTLFTFSEALFYRTAFFGSTEALGLFFAFTFLALYQRKKYIWSLFPLILVPLSHILPFIFVVGYVLVDLISQKRYKLPIAVLILTLLFLFNPWFSPHKTQSYQIPTSSLSLSKLFLYNPEDILIGIITFISSAILILSTLSKFKSFKKPDKLLFSSLVFFATLSLLAYNTAVIAPFRFIPYIVIILIPIFFKVLDLRAVALLSILILTFSFTSPLIGGTNYYLWTNDAVTQDEMLAIQYLGSKGIIIKDEFITNDTIDGARFWFADTPSEQYLRLLYGGHKSGNDHIYYIFLSPRMRTNAFFLVPVEGGRTRLTHRAVSDIWASNPNWIRLYPNSETNLYGIYIYVLRGINGH